MAPGAHGRGFAAGQAKFQVLISRASQTGTWIAGSGGDGGRFVCGRPPADGGVIWRRGSNGASSACGRCDGRQAQQAAASADGRPSRRAGAAGGRRVQRATSSADGALTRRRVPPAPGSGCSGAPQGHNEGSPPPWGPTGCTCTETCACEHAVHNLCAAGALYMGVPSPFPRWRISSGKTAAPRPISL
jgi:hypothetical protein